jgi:hypothetical protein
MDMELVGDEGNIKSDIGTDLTRKFCERAAGATYEILHRHPASMIDHNEGARLSEDKGSYIERACPPNATADQLDRRAKFLNKINMILIR